MSSSPSEIMSRLPLRPYQVVAFAICAIVLVADGVDAQLLGVVQPMIIEEFGVGSGIFGYAAGAALVGFGLGSWSGGWLGDRMGRRWALALAAIVFSLGTIAASTSAGLLHIMLWRVIGGLGFGAAYSNAITLAGEWLPERWRSVGATTLSVGTPAGGLVVASIASTGFVTEQGWRASFVIFGIATLILCLVLIIGILRDSPSFLLARGKKAEAQQALRKITDEDIDLVPESHPGDTAAGSVGVFDRSNLRMNIGIAVTFTAVVGVAYAILQWTTTLLTARGFTLEQAAEAVAWAGATSIASSIAVGFFIYRFGSRPVVLAISGMLFVSLLALGWQVETLSEMPTEGERNMIYFLVGTAAAIFSAGVASNYAVMTRGYPASCRSAGIGFGIFMSRIGAVAGASLGGWWLELGGDSAIVFFSVLCVAALAVSTSAFVIDTAKHVPPAKRG